ncbi:MAG: hypothetical protein FWF96_00595 [Kiritimatiellaeota bacterium]|nr:hypothetical protein [Kiritimatiellota bacterium]
MKKIFTVICFALVASLSARAANPRAAVATGVSLDGEIVNGGLNGTLSFNFDIPKGASMRVLSANVALSGVTLPKNALLETTAGGYVLKPKPSFFSSGAKGAARLAFSSAKTSVLELSLPDAPVRRFAIKFDPGAHDVSVENAALSQNADGAMCAGFLSQNNPVRIHIGEVRQEFARAEARHQCDAVTTAELLPGAVRFKSVFTLASNGAAASQFAFALPAGAALTSASTESAGARHELVNGVVAFSSHADFGSPAMFTLEYQTPLAALPCVAVLAPASPTGGVITKSGSLVVRPAAGTLRVSPVSAANAWQIPSADTAALGYSYGHSVPMVEVRVAAVTPSVRVENTTTLSIEDALATTEAVLQFDIREAPADALGISIAGMDGWTLASVSGASVGDWSASKIFFDKPVSGNVAVVVRLERKIDSAQPGEVAAPVVSVEGAAAQSGYFVAAAGRGIALEVAASEVLSPVHVASVPSARAGAQLAYRHRSPDWSASVKWNRAKTVVYAELFHLVSPGEGVVRGSTAALLHVAGAPARAFTFAVPERFAQVDVSGAGIDSFTREAGALTVVMARPVIGDRTLAISYEEPLGYGGAEIGVAEISAVGAASEIGFAVIAGPASLRVAEAGGLPAGMIRIAADEIPEAYASMLLSPVTAAWRHGRAPHTAAVRLIPLETAASIPQVVDFLSIETEVSRGGAAVTKARYSVKNASGQHLALAFPEGAVLWAVRKLDANGGIVEIPSQSVDGMLLIPVERPRDPNQATTVEVQFATQSASAKNMVLTAPAPKEAPVTFAEWNVTAADKLVIRNLGGNMAGGRTSSSAAARGDTRPPIRLTRTAMMPDDAPPTLTFSAVRPLFGGNVAVVSWHIVAAGVLFVVAMALLVATHRRVWLALGMAAVVYVLLSLDNDFTLLIAVVAFLFVLAGFVRLGVRQALRKSGAAAPLIIASLCAVDAHAVPLEAPNRGILGDDNENAVVLKSETEIRYAPEGEFLTYRVQVEIKKAGAYGLPVYKRETMAKGILESRVRPISRSWFSMSGLSLANGFLPAVSNLSTNFIAMAKVVRFADSDQSRPVEVPFLYAAKTGTYTFTISHDAYNPHVIRNHFLDNPKGVASHSPGLRVSALPWETVPPNPSTPTGLHNANYPVRKDESSAITPGLVYSFHPFKSANATVVVRHPGAFELKCDALAGRVDADDGETLVTARIPPDAFDAFGAIHYTFERRQTDPADEPLLVSASLETEAAVRHGFVEAQTTVRFKVLQGVAKTHEIKIPAPFVVTGSNAREWTFDAETRVFTAGAAALQDGAFTINCAALVQDMPFTLKFEMPQAIGVTAQNATFTLTSDATAAVSVAESQGLEPVGLRKYQYGADASVALAAEPVKPEIRAVVEQSVSIGDERVVVAANARIEVSKAGVFAVGLDVPDGYAIDTLSGDAVASFDDARKQGGGVTVSFGREVTGATRVFVSCSAAMPNGGRVSSRAAADEDIRPPDPFIVPRVSVTGARRQTGAVNITAERGTRLSLTQGKGVEAATVDDLSASRRGNAVSLATTRPDWEAELSVRVMAPLIRSELLQTADVSEGILQHKAHLRFTIENSGAKQFRLLVPVKGASVSVTGRRIARVTMEDENILVEGERPREPGSIWLIELEGKAEGEYAASVFYQEQAADAAPVRPVRVLDAERQSGWMAVFGQNRVKVDAVALDGLRPEDTRSIPDTFGAGIDVSSAIGAWRITDPDTAALSLGVTRHDAAQVLPAEVRGVNHTSVVSLGGRVLTSTSLKLFPGKMRFLRVVLPTGGAELWTAQVNGVSVAVSMEDNGVLCVPLDGASDGTEAEVVFVWVNGGRTSPSAATARETRALQKLDRLDAPRFPDLPLKNIAWQVFTPEGWKTKINNKDFDEVTVLHTPFAISKFGFDAYSDMNLRGNMAQISRAKINLSKAGEMLERGENGRAQAMLLEAMNSSQADHGLNEDARVQFEKVAFLNVSQNIVARQGQNRAYNNVFAEVEAPQDERELDGVSSRIIQQQIASAKPAQAIAVTLPGEGASRSYTRALQSEPGGAMALELRFSRDWSATPAGRFLSSRALWFSAASFPAAWLLALFAFGRRKNKGV